MNYYKYLDGTLVKVDAEKNKAFSVFNGVEKQMENRSKTVADAILENKKITKEEYESNLRK